MLKNSSSAALSSLFARDACPDDQPPTPRLFTTAQKLQSFAELGLHTCLVHAFDRTFTSLSHQEFLHDCLRTRLNMQHLIVGTDFRFGYRRQGSIDWLRTQDGFGFTTIAPLLQAGQRVSSSAIRALVRCGDVSRAAQMLGRAYMLAGKVEKGQQLGHQLGIPTANLGMVAQLLPADGVYAGWAVLDTSTILAVPSDAEASVVNIGVRPTFDGSNARTIEVHVIDRKFATLYGRDIFIFFVKRLRAEIKFPDRTALQAQIAQDIAQARSLLSEEKL